jgi:hypothetical protein
VGGARCGARARARAAAPRARTVAGVNDCAAARKPTRFSANRSWLMTSMMANAAHDMSCPSMFSCARAETAESSGA